MDNFARTHTGSVSVSGVNFGALDFTASGRTDALACATAGWASATTVLCSAATTPTVVTAEVTVAGLAGTRLPAFTFDGGFVMWCPHRRPEYPRPASPAPVVSDAAAPNRPFSTALSLSVHGLNFNHADVTHTAHVSLAACATAAWTSATGVACFQASQGSPDEHGIVVTTAGMVGTSGLAFTFDGACFALPRMFGSVLHPPRA